MLFCAWNISVHLLKLVAYFLIIIIKINLAFQLRGRFHTVISFEPRHNVTYVLSTPLSDKSGHLLKATETRKKG